MPCGGIYPLELGPYDICWVCQACGVDHYCEEFDCGLHRSCVPAFLNTKEGLLVLEHGHGVIIAEVDKPDADFWQQKG